MNLNLVICPRPCDLGAALVLRVQIRETGLENPHHFIREVGDLDKVQVNTMLILLKGWVMADREGKDGWDGAIVRILAERASICGGVVTSACNCL